VAKRLDAARRTSARRAAFALEGTQRLDVKRWSSRLDLGGSIRRSHTDEQVKQALERGGIIDITTRGRKTGEPRRKEIRFHNIDGRLYITGTPGRRDWYANLLAHPEFTLHLKQSVRADLPARATPVLDKALRRTIIAAIHQRLARYRDVEAWVEGSPLVAVELLVA
jgi:deazaflavin-dependent oxidoreductase (nitroreductase family)